MNPERDARSKFFRSTSFNVSGQVILLIGNLVITPVFLSYLGTDGYGLWAMVLAMSGTVVGMDLGISVGLLRAVPEHVATDGYKHLGVLTGAVILFYLIFSAASVLLALILAPVILSLFDFGDVPQDVAWKMIIAAAVILSVSSLSGVTRAILQGLNRFDLASLLAVFTFLIFAIASVISLHLGYGLMGLVGSMVFMFALQIAGGVIFIRRFCPLYEVNFRSALSREVWRYLFRFGSRIQISYVTDIFKTQVPKLLAGIFFGPSAAGMYDLGNRIANAGWTIPAALLPAIVPTASEVQARGDRGRLRSIYTKGTMWLVMIALPMGVALALFSEKIFEVWLGPGYESAAFVLLCLALGNVLHLMTGVGTSIGRGIGIPGIEARYQVLTLVLYVTLGYSLMLLLGFKGIATGVALSCAIGSIFFLWMFSKQMGIHFRSFMSRAFLWPAGLVLPAIVVTVAAIVLLNSRPAAFEQLLLLGSIFTLIYLVTVAMYLRRTGNAGLISRMRATLSAAGGSNGD